MRRHRPPPRPRRLRDAGRDCGRRAGTGARAEHRDALQTERARLRTQLDKVNAEIDGLKRAGGGVRDDYRLRARLADAESLARRLIDIEARLGIHVDATAKNQPPPTAAPTDGPADLDAKADILADQSRRVRAQADALGAPRHRRQGTAGAAPARGRPRSRSVRADGRFEAAGGAAVRAPLPVVTTGSKNQAGAASDVPSPGQSSIAPTAPPTTNTTNAGLTERSSAPLSVQLRDLLDTATLTDVRRVEAAGAAAASPQALERAAAALRARADWLDGQSRAMRARAQAK